MRRVSLPLSPEDMVNYFKNKDEVYVIDTNASLENLNEYSMLMYLSNLNITCTLDDVTPTMIRHYMTLREPSNIRNLIKVHANIMYYAKFGEVYDEGALEGFSVPQIKLFIENNIDLVAEHMLFLESIPLFIITRKESESVETIGSVKQTGILDSFGYGLINLLNHYDFSIVYFQEMEDLEDQVYLSRYFDEYIFGGKNLFHLIDHSPLMGLIATLNQGEDPIAGNVIEAESNDADD